MPVAILKEVGTQLILSETAENKKRCKKQKSENTLRSNQSICNSKRLVRNLFAANVFDYFFTITFSPSTAKQYDADELIKLVRNKLADMRENVEGFKQMKYVLIPEPHTDGRKQLHIHGVMCGICDTSLANLRKVSGRKTRYITQRLKQSKHTYTSLYLKDTCGYNLFEPIEDIDKLANYLIKMFDTASLWRNGSKRLVYASHGLERPIEVARGKLAHNETALFSSLAKSQYKHRSSETGSCFGISYVFDNTFENKQWLIKLLNNAN